MFTAPDILKDTDPGVLQSLAKTSSRIYIVVIIFHRMLWNTCLEGASFVITHKTYMVLAMVKGRETSFYLNKDIYNF